MTFILHILLAIACLFVAYASLIAVMALGVLMFTWFEATLNAFWHLIRQTLAKRRKRLP